MSRLTSRSQLKPGEPAWHMKSGTRVHVARTPGDVPDRKVWVRLDRLTVRQVPVNSLSQNVTATWGDPPLGEARQLAADLAYVETEGGS